MTQDKLRELLKEYRQETPIGISALANKIGTSYVTFKRFLDGEDVRVDSWKKIEDFITKSVLRKDPYEIISNNT